MTSCENALLAIFSMRGRLDPCRLFSRGVIFTRPRVSLALLSLRKKWGTTRSLDVQRLDELRGVPSGDEKLCQMLDITSQTK